MQDHVQGGTISSVVAVAVCHAGMAIVQHIRLNVLAACPCEPQSGCKAILMIQELRDIHG